MRQFFQLLTYVLLLLAVLSYGSSSLLAQHSKESGPYYLSLKRDIPYSVAALGTVLLSDELERQVPTVTLAEIDLETLPFFDRIPDGFRSKRARLWSDYTRDAAKYLPLLMLFDKSSRKDAPKLALLFAESLYLTKGITDATKAVVRRPRPYVRDFLPDLNPEVTREDRASFFSGHTSGAAVGGFFFARVFSDYFPNSKLKPYAWIAGAGLPALTGYLRVKAGRHYPSDVVVGYLVGGLIGYGIPALHRKPAGQLSLCTDFNGLTLRYRIIE